jgi:hypothetical protein
MKKKSLIKNFQLDLSDEESYKNQRILNWKTNSDQIYKTFFHCSSSFNVMTKLERQPVWNIFSLA